MKVGISKQLTSYLILPCIAITAVGLYDLWATGQKRMDQNIILIIFFGIPGLLFTWLLLYHNIQFKDNKKVRKAERFFQLPFSSLLILPVFMVSSLFLVAGLASVFVDRNMVGGLPLLLVALLVIVLAAVCLEHPKIWLADTFNANDMIEEFKNNPPENSLAYQNGIFTYQDSSFTIQFENEAKTIQWDDIVLIGAYKIDLYTIDRIVIEIQLTGTLITLTEENPGYMKFMENASQQLNHFKKDWFMLVAFPAFEKNRTIIYEKTT